MLREVRASESNPPLYYVLAWAWSKLFGTGAVGLRSLSALFGAATIPIAYLIGRELLSRRAGLIAAALVALNPMLIWYSQEARSYALLVFLCSASLLFFLRVRRSGDPWDLLLWSLSLGAGAVPATTSPPSRSRSRLSGCCWRPGSASECSSPSPASRR